MKTDNLGGRKFILAILCIVVIIEIVAFTAHKNITETFASQVLFYLTSIMGLFVVGNFGEKYLKKGGNNNDGQRSSNGNN